MRISRRVLGLVGAGVAALALGWSVSPATVALYDGVNFPDEPYRYVAPAAGQQTSKPPTVATAPDINVTTGTNDEGFQVTSGESGPQVSLYVPSHALQPGGDVAAATVTVTPEAPDADAPGDGSITGNVYRVTASAGGKSIGLAGQTAGTITLRAPTGFTVTPVIEFRTSPTASWARVQTSRVGADIFTAPFEALGDYATVLPRGGTAVGGGSHTLLITLLVVAGVLVVALVAVRGMRAISGAAHEGAADGTGETGEAGETGETGGTGETGEAPE